MNKNIDRSPKLGTLGGYEYSAPWRIGAGIVSRVQEENSMSPNKLYKNSLYLFEQILTPIDGSPSVKEAYDYASNEEVEFWVNFFTEGLLSKKSEASLTPIISSTEKDLPPL